MRVKASLKNLPERLRLFVPMFTELLASVGTKNYRYDEFNDRMLSCTNGLEVRVDKYAEKEDIGDRHENLYLSVGFLDRNIEKAMQCLTEIVATPNFDEPANIADLVKMESINKANNIGNKGLQYASSYGQSGLKAFARSFETLRSDIFFCQYAAEILRTSKPQQLLQDAIVKMTEIASYAFTAENMEIAVHGNKKKFPLIQAKLEVMLNALKNENSRFNSTTDVNKMEFEKPVYYKSFFKTPLAVNMCTESLVSVPSSNDDFAALLVMGDLLTFNYLLPTIREKGGAYGTGCQVNESGVLTLYSYRDPKIESTFDNFERAVGRVIGKQFEEQSLREAKLHTFQKLDKVLEPSLKGLLQFTRGYTDEQRMKLRLQALDLTSDDIARVAGKYLMHAMEKGKTSRVVFGSQSADLGELGKKGWKVQNPIDFLSYEEYFQQYAKNDNVKEV